VLLDGMLEARQRFAIAGDPVVGMMAPQLATTPVDFDDTSR
jgi:hypothetical protein